MFSDFLSWLKSHKLTSLLILVIAFLLWKQYRPPPIYQLSSRGGGVSESAPALSLKSKNSLSSPIPPTSEVAPSDSPNRLVIQETTLSLVVKDVTSSLSQIQSKAESLGGFLVNSHLSKPEESASGAITVRVPSDKLAEALAAFRSAGLRVIDEQINGRDVTDQYVDLDSRLATLEKTKTKFEEILNRAVTVSEILNVQREIINLQSQIDNLKGQQQYLKKSADLSKITVYLSTDEFSLPYAPKEAWRPGVIAKLAVRALVTDLRKIAAGIIWIAVFAPLWLPILFIVWYINKKKKVF